MKLNNLLEGASEIRVFGDVDVDVTSIFDDSRLVKEGGVFVAIKGLTIDGHKFVPQAIKSGAKVVVGETDLKQSWLKSVTYVKVKNTRDALGIIASKWFGNPGKKLKVIGVTGTKGKTTTTHMIYHILNNMGKGVSMISTITNSGLHVTTPSCIDLHKNLKEMVDEGIKYAVVEVSSHGIDQDRIAGVEFDIGVLTNIKPEHLDYHRTFKKYKKTKKDFINSAKEKVISPKNTKINIFPGKFNNLNAEAAILVAGKIGIKRRDALYALQSFKLPKGRLEEIKNNKGFRIFIDFAHTPDSLEQVLTYLKTITKGKLIAVFGCAGERDTKKRPLMGEISARLADVSIFTAEDPRSESVYEIIKEMVKGVQKNKAVNIKHKMLDNEKKKIILQNGDKSNIYFIIPERGEAISFVIQNLGKKGDVIVILGKGHEKSMAYNGIEYPWSDLEAVKIALKRGVKNIDR